MSAVSGASTCRLGSATMPAKPNTSTTSTRQLKIYFAVACERAPELYEKQWHSLDRHVTVVVVFYFEPQTQAAEANLLIGSPRTSICNVSQPFLLIY